MTPSPANGSFEDLALDEVAEAPRGVAVLRRDRAVVGEDAQERHPRAAALHGRRVVAHAVERGPRREGRTAAARHAADQATRLRHGAAATSGTRASGRRISFAARMRTRPAIPAPSATNLHPLGRSSVRARRSAQHARPVAKIASLDAWW